MIRGYLRILNAALASYQWVRSVRVLRCDVLETEHLQILTYRFRVILNDDSVLELMERVLASRDAPDPETTTYRFHWQDRNGTLIRRWDCAPHFPRLPGFPHHIHVGHEDTVLPGSSMNGLGVLAEIDRDLSKV